MIKYTLVMEMLYERDENGCLILDELKVVNNFLEGRKPKLWLTDGENLFLFKMVLQITKKRYA